MTKSHGEDPRKTDVKVSLIGGHRLDGATLHARTVTASLVGGADVDLTDVDIPDGAKLRITKLSLIGGVSLRVRPDVRVEVHGLRLGGVKDDGPSEPGGPTVRVDAWGLRVRGGPLRRGDGGPADRHRFRTLPGAEGGGGRTRVLLRPGGVRGNAAVPRVAAGPADGSGSGRARCR